jgi:hypothetical protein
MTDSKNRPGQQLQSNAITLTWDCKGKRWRVEVRVWNGRGWARYWCWAESTHELSQLEAKRLMEAVRREIESWIVFE